MRQKGRAATARPFLYGSSDALLGSPLIDHRFQSRNITTPIAANAAHKPAPMPSHNATAAGELIGTGRRTVTEGVSSSAEWLVTRQTAVRLRYQPSGGPSVNIFYTDQADMTRTIIFYRFAENS